MLNALVRIRLLYSCQTWSCTKTQMNNVNATYVSFLRKMVKGGYRRKENSWAYVFTNNDLLRMAGAEDVHTFVCKQQVKFVKKVKHRGTSHEFIFSGKLYPLFGMKFSMISCRVGCLGAESAIMCGVP